KKLSRRKGKPISSRYRSNGYVHPPQPQRALKKTRPKSDDETSDQPLAPTPHPSNINQKEK
ncbi:hypothetical protein, partial [Pseudomonas fluorescens]|uniref:hypothetical protein n=1 Tax=Pseudomonas fluorescens TaxID=294 RepID=UPI001C83D34E